MTKPNISSLKVTLSIPIACGKRVTANDATAILAKNSLKRSRCLRFNLDSLDWTIKNQWLILVIIHYNICHAENFGGAGGDGNFAP